MIRSPPNSSDPESGAAFFGQPVSFSCDPPEAAVEFTEFMSRVRGELPTVMKEAETYFLEHVSEGLRPEIWVADILLEEGETTPEHWALQVEGDAGEHSAAQSWILTIEHGKVVDMYGMD